MLLRQRRLFRGRDRADDLGAQGLRPLAEDEADAAGGGVHEDGLARLHPVGAAEEILRGHALQQHRRRLLVGDAGGDLHQLVGGRDAVHGVGAHRIGDDPVADLELLHLRPDRLDDSRAFASEHRRKRHRIEAGAEIDVDEVEADRGVADQHLARAGRADLDLLPAQDLGAAGLVDADRMGFHGCLARWDLKMISVRPLARVAASRS